MKNILLFILLLCLSTAVVGQKNPNAALVDQKIEGYENIKKSELLIVTLLLGPIGGHRVLLGTKAIVPLVYTLTLGGGLGLVPLIDFFVTLFTKNPETYANESRVLMWLHKEKAKG